MDSVDSGSADDTGDTDSGPECDTAAPQSDEAVCADACGVDVAELADVLIGEHADDWAGYAVAGVPGGGLVVGAPSAIADAPGVAYVWWGPVHGETSLGTAAQVLRSEFARDSFGESVAAVGGDGSVVVGGDFALEVYERGASEPMLSFISEDEDEWCCRAVTSGDFTGDGIADIAFKGPDQVPDEWYGGWVALLDGTLAGQVGVDDVYAEVKAGDGRIDVGLGYAIRGLGDIDGDGIDDLAVPGNGSGDGNEEYLSSVYVFRGPIVGSNTLAEADVKIRTYSYGIAPAGDFDGDGLADMLLYDDADGNEYGEDHVRVLGSMPDGEVMPDAAFLTITADAPFSIPHSGASDPPPSFVGEMDMNGDNWMDLAIEVGCESPQLDGTDQIWLLTGPASGHVYFEAIRDPHIHALEAPSTLASADLDEDGSAEFVFARENANAWSGSVSIVPWDLFGGH